MQFSECTQRTNWARSDVKPFSEQCTVISIHDVNCQIPDLSGCATDETKVTRLFCCMTAVACPWRQIRSIGTFAPLIIILSTLSNITFYLPLRNRNL